MKKPVVIVGLLLTLACALLYILRPNLLAPISRAAYDALLRLDHRGIQADAVAVVDIDDRSLSDQGQWPWPRYQVAELVAKILAAGAKVVALDIVFPEPDRTSPIQMQRALDRAFGIQMGLQEIPAEYLDYDQMLARTLSSGSTVLSMYLHGVEEELSVVDEDSDPSYRGRFFTRGGASAGEHLLQADSLTISIPPLSRAAANNAFFNVLPDADNVVRNAPLVWAFGPRRLYPSVALESVRMFLGVSQIGLDIERDGVAGLRLGDRWIPTDARGRLLINYRGSQRDPTGLDRAFPTFPATDVLAGRLPPSALTNRIVFIGTSAAGLRDLRATPLTPAFSGVEIQATIVDNLLTGDFLQRPSWMIAANLLIIVVSGLLLTFATVKQRSWLAFVTAVAAAALCLAASFHLFRTQRLVFLPEWPLFSMGLLYPVLAMVSFWQAERQARWMRNAFGSMVSGKVLSYLEEHPEDIALTREEREATVLFSDLRGFTSIAESIDPASLSRMLQEYLGEMTNLIMARDGYVDKYIGDMIMAEWGVPYPIKNHAAQACHAALEQAAHLERIRPRLRQTYGHELFVRMGVNTGPMIAGNMGSERRFQYTVLGDAVNLAARLEPLNREFGTTIIIGHDTYLQVRDLFETRLLDRVAVAGKAAEVLVYELLARKGELAPRKRELVKAYEDALRLHWEGKFDEPVACLRRALELDPGDPPSIRLYEKITGVRYDPAEVGSAPALSS